LAFKKRQFYVLAIRAVAVLVVLSFYALRATGDEARFWKLTLKLQVRSDFRTGSGGENTGSYILETAWAGFLEEDGPDFIIYHLGSELARWECRLLSGLVHSNQLEAPELKLNYVEGKEEEVNFYYSFNPQIVSCSGSSSGSELRLVVPSVPWSGAVEKIPWFKRKLISGDRNLRLGRGLLSRNEVRKEFNWEEETSFEEPGFLVVYQRSRIRVAMELIRCQKL